MSVTAPAGFVANGVACGIKPSGDPDLSLVATADGAAVPAAAVFTQNLVVAAPVTTSRAHLQATGGRAAAVILNSGNANACTGHDGAADAEAMCAATADALGCAADEVLVCSTGLIGPPLPIERITKAVPDLVAGRGGSPVDAVRAAEAIMTTDTRAKQTAVRGADFVVGGMAKGAAMLAPNMATMLAVLTTDAAVEPDQLQDVLRAGVADSFNAITVDGCTSTNDTVILLASGRAGTPASLDAFRTAVAEACHDLALQMVGDAEGHTKVVKVRVTGAASDDEARRAARKVAESQLVKCSWYGKDPYWGRVASDLGTAGVALDVSALSIAYGGTVVSRGCIEVDHDRAAVAAHMEGEYLELTCDLGVGTGEARILTNDLTHAYVDENMGTS
ncbi:MAG TPA: bifunctional glutamate N-acetyltransferase/amino-acid acetyltransferase ArgJ [Acidimicrobiales bacterium]